MGDGRTGLDILDWDLCSHPIYDILTSEKMQLMYSMCLLYMPPFVVPYSCTCMYTHLFLIYVPLCSPFPFSV